MKPSFQKREGGPPHNAKKNYIQPPQQKQQQQQREGPTTPSPSSSARSGGSSNVPVNPAALKKFVEHVSLDVSLEITRSLDVRGKQLTSLPAGLGTMLKSVRKLDLSDNALTDLAPLSSLPLLSNLSVSQNSTLRSLHSLDCPQLVVLSVAACGLTSLKGIERCAPSLRTLVANDNDLQLQAPAEQREARSLPKDVRITRTVAVAVENYRALASLVNCETVVLTRNPTLCKLYPDRDSEHEDGRDTAAGGAEDTEGDDEAARKERQQATQLLAAAHPLSVFEGLLQLKKLSLSDCHLTCLPARWFLPLVVELRLANNELRSLRPDGVIIRSLKTLDVSHNKLTTIATLRRCHFVHKLNLRGNPLIGLYVTRDAEEGQPTTATTNNDNKSNSVPVSLQRSLKRMLTGLDAIDGQPLLSEEKLAFRRRPRQAANASEEDSDAEANEEEGTAGPKRRRLSSSNSNNKKNTKDNDEDAETDSLAEEAMSTARRTTTQRQRDEQRAAQVRAEADERDVVVEAPAAVLQESRAQIVRRERTTLVPKKGVVLSGEAAVAQLRKQKKESQAW